MLVKIANNEDLDLTASKKKSDLCLLCLSGPFLAGMCSEFYNILGNTVINIIKYLIVYR